MNIRILFSILIIIICQVSIFAQDLDSLLNAEIDNENKNRPAEAAFKTTRIVLGQSIENVSKGELNFLISHHFGNLNSGAYNFWGLDYSEIRLGFEYGITSWFSLGVGRSSYNKAFDGNLKIKILRQSSGTKSIPVSMSFYSNMAITTLHWEYPERDNRFDSRLSYAFELLLARKFNSSITFQLTPSMIHRNLVETEEDQNDVYSIGFGGRVKLSKRISVNAEYYYVLPGKTADDYYDALSAGIDIETGGHIFQIYLTNSNGMTEQYFIPETVGSWANGDIKLGFNISRTFTLVKKKTVDIENDF